jgi:hypothetical protein
MRLVFKSVPILHENSYRSAGGTTTVTTYNLADVRDHILEVPRWKLATCPQIFGLVAVGCVSTWFLFLIWGEFSLVLHPYGILIPAACAFAFFYFIGYLLAPYRFMRLEALRDRNLPAGSKIHVVPEKDWPGFLYKLR